MDAAKCRTARYISPEALRFPMRCKDVAHPWTQSLEKPVILIVEEEVLIRMSAVHIVEDAGYTAVEARNADEAIVILESRRDIRAVFTDNNMGGTMDGLKLAHAIRGRWPPIHLIVTSGLNVEDKLPAKGRFILKPYSAEQVTEVLRHLFALGSSPGRSLNADGQSRGKVA